MVASEYILAFLQGIGWPEMLVIGLVALLIFGRRLPEVGRSLGRGIVEFKKGLKDTTNEVKGALPEEHEVSTRQPSGNSAKSVEEEKPDTNFNHP